jgi:hypothetical protein
MVSLSMAMASPLMVPENVSLSVNAPCGGALIFASGL